MRPSIRHAALRAASLFLGLAGVGERVAAQTTIYAPYVITTVAGTAHANGSVDGTGSAARFFLPDGVAVDSSGNLYIADTQNETIREITPAGVVTTIAGAAGMRGSLDGTGAAARFSTPGGVAVDKNGNLYVADVASQAIRKITPTVANGATTWAVSTLAGSLGNFGSQDGTGPGALFDQPYGVAVDTGGNVYVADSKNDTIRKITPAGVVTTLAGSPGVAGSANGTGAGAQFSQPYGVAVDASGNVYVADTLNNMIRKITPAGVVTTLANSSGADGSGDGSAASAQFNSPRGVAVDAAGNVYVADTTNGELRKISTGSSPLVTTMAGGGNTGVDGTGSDAGFYNPSGIAVDGSGNVYVADTTDETIRTGYLAIPPTFTAAASPAAASVATGRTAVFNAQATGAPAPSYQWTFQGSTTIPGAALTTDPILMVTGTTSASAGTYTCTATNSAGTATSSATLAVAATANPGYLTNLSGRGQVGSGPANGLFGGFGIAGTGAKQLLIRGIGPGLLVPYPYFVGELGDPYLTLYNSSPAVIGTNDNWGGGATLVNAQAAVGAYALPANSLDAMFYLSEPAASYSVEVSGNNGTTGIAVIELYDADTAVPPPARLVNLSVRAPVGTGSNILFGGFSIGGTTDETVLLRAIGPGFPSSFGLAGAALAQPVLTIYDHNGNPLYTNTVWGGDPILVSAMSTVGAYPLAANTQDSLLLVTLPPGNDTAEISGVNNTTGIAAVEIYELP